MQVQVACSSLSPRAGMLSVRSVGRTPCCHATLLTRVACPLQHHKVLCAWHCSECRWWPHSGDPEGCAVNAGGCTHTHSLSSCDAHALLHCNPIHLSVGRTNRMLASVPQSCHHDYLLGTRCDTLQAWVSNPRNATCTQCPFCCSIVCSRSRNEESLRSPAMCSRLCLHAAHRPKQRSLQRSQP